MQWIGACISRQCRHKIGFASNFSSLRGACRRSTLGACACATVSAMPMTPERTSLLSNGAPSPGSPSLQQAHGTSGDAPASPGARLARAGGSVRAALGGAARSAAASRFERLRDVARRMAAEVEVRDRVDQYLHKVCACVCRRARYYYYYYYYYY